MLPWYFFRSKIKSNHATLSKLQCTTSSLTSWEYMHFNHANKPTISSICISPKYLKSEDQKRKSYYMTSTIHPKLQPFSFWFGSLISSIQVLDKYLESLQTKTHTHTHTHESTKVVDSQLSSRLWDDCLGLMCWYNLKMRESKTKHNLHFDIEVFQNTI